MFRRAASSPTSTAGAGSRTLTGRKAALKARLEAATAESSRQMIHPGIAPVSRHTVERLEQALAEGHYRDRSMTVIQLAPRKQ